MADLSVIWMKVTDSTNLDAFRHRDECQDGTVWAAEFQTAGRGQRGNVWNSGPAENLTFSILLKPIFIKSSDQFIISAAASVAMCRYLAHRGVAARIKWPNDIYAGDRKICGMLIEHRLSGDRISASVVGIGLNVLQKTFPPELPNPVSMVQLSPDVEGCDLKKELSDYLGCFFSIYESLQEPAAVEELYGKYLSLMYRRGEWHRFIEMSPDGTRQTGEINGCIVGIDRRTSRLKLKTSSGEVRLYAFKEIRYVL